MKRWVQIVLVALCLFFTVLMPAQASDWYFKPSKNHQPSTTEPEFKALLQKYNGVFQGDTDKKVIYLTFDNGYEAGYTGRILDILKAKHVPAAFFITGHYISDKPALVKRMVVEGHIVGNHSWGHLNPSTISKERYIQDLKKLDNAFAELTHGKHMHYVRPPQGVFTERSLKLDQQLGYTTVFWSFAYQDWLRDQQKGGQYAYDHIMKRIHPGAILLLHTVSKDNADALGRVIDDLRKQGYQFKSLDDLMSQRSLHPSIQ